MGRATFDQFSVGAKSITSWFPIGSHLGYANLDFFIFLTSQNYPNWTKTNKRKVKDLKCKSLKNLPRKLTLWTMACLQINFTKSRKVTFERKWSWWIQSRSPSLTWLSRGTSARYVSLIGRKSDRLFTVIYFRDSCASIELPGAPNDGFLSDPLNRYFRLSGVPLKLCRFILGCAIIFSSVRSF